MVGVWNDGGSSPFRAAGCPCLRRNRLCALVCARGCVGVRHDGREVENGDSVFSLIVDVVSVDRVDSVYQGEVHPDAVDV
eukprot:257757-Pleurochrysis_carterae.AAC.1